MSVRQLTLVIAVIVCAMTAAPARAQAPGLYPAPATIQLTIIKGSYFFGLTGGSGTLYFGGQAFPLGVGGLSFGLSIGGSTADLVGEVYNLSSPYDIEGVYGAGKASYAVAGGEASLILQNSRGVEIHLRGKQIGLEISLDLSGISIGLK